jgi:FkbM family methyltransferase
MKNLFLDLGAHTGEALEEALRPVYKIDKVYAIEPSQFGLSKLAKFKDNRIKIFSVAVSDHKGTAELFSAGSVGGGLFSDKNRHWNNTERVQVVKFSEWAIENLNSSDNIYIKINVEGSELFILQEILKIHQKFQIKSILLSIDIYKVPSLHGYINELEKLISDFPIKIDIRESKSVTISMRNWFTSLGLSHCNTNPRRVIIDSLRPFLPLNRNILRLLKPLFPKKFWVFVALRIGPNRVR